MGWVGGLTLGRGVRCLVRWLSRGLLRLHVVLVGVLCVVWMVWARCGGGCGWVGRWMHEDARSIFAFSAKHDDVGGLLRAPTATLLQQQPAKQRHIPSRCMLPPWSLPQLLVLVPTFRNRKALLMSRRFGVGEVWTVLTLHPGNQIQELSA